MFSLTLTVSHNPILGTVRSFYPRERHYVARHVPGVMRLDKRQDAKSKPHGPERPVRGGMEYGFAFTNG